MATYRDTEDGLLNAIAITNRDHAYAPNASIKADRLNHLKSLHKRLAVVRKKNQLGNVTKEHKMIKTFNEMLAERDEEYTYRVFSTVNIHDPERRERIRMEFMPFEIKSLECEAYKPLSTMNTMFPEEPYSPTFSVKVITRYPITQGFIQTLAMILHIHTAHLRVEGEYGPELVNKPEEVSSSDSQKLVGTKRIGEFIKELQDDRKNRAEMSWTREVYESFSTTHRGLRNIIKTPIRNGYYMIEAYQQGGKKYLRAEGPFDHRPEGKPYHDRLQVTNPQVISEELHDGVYGIDILVED